MFHKKPLLRTNKHWYVFFVTIITLTGTFLIVFGNYNSNILNIILYNSLELEQFAIKTKGCIIPALNPFDETILKKIYTRTIESCPNANYSLLEHNKTHIWLSKDDRHLKKYNVTERENVTCCYKSFYRPQKIDVYSRQIDNRIKYKPCIWFKDIVRRRASDEYTRVICYFKHRKVYEQFFLFAPEKNLTQNGRPLQEIDKPAYNVLVLGIDSISRMNFHRTMPKTLAYLREKGAVEFKGYNKIGENTYPNLVALLMGHKREDLKKICLPFEHNTYDSCPFIWHWYKDVGYYTAYGEDCFFTFNHLIRDGFLRAPTDYYAYPFMKEAEKCVGNSEDITPNLCMNDRYVYQVLLNYVKDLTETLSEKKLFGFFWQTSMTHEYVHYPMVIDKSYEQFFKQLEISKYTEKTVIFLVSDHGIRWDEIRATKQGYMEERLPFVFVLTPQSFRDSYPIAYHNLQFNSERLTTPFDLHETLLDLKDLENIEDNLIRTRMQSSYAEQRGISLFLEVPSNRTCEMASIEDQWCTCNAKWQDITLRKHEAVSAANHLIKHINGLFEHYRGMCSELILEEFVDVKQLVKDEVRRNGKEWREYVIIAKASPGGGLFEANMRLEDQKWAVVGSVSRINLYGNQSSCISDPELRNYCFCVQ